MSHTRQMTLAAVGVGIAIALISLLITWPNHRQAQEIGGQTADLRTRIADLGGRTRELAQLSSELAHAKARIERDLKVIPDHADIAGLMHRLSQEVDRVRVLDQTFIKGSPGEAIVGGKEPVQAMPLTVEMEATFDSVFALIQNAESIDRLIRVSSVRVMCKRDKGEFVAATAPIVKATIGLEAIFEPPDEREAVKR